MVILVKQLVSTILWGFVMKSLQVLFMLVIMVITVFEPMHYSKLMINTQFLFYEEIFIHDIITDNGLRH